jgi:NAD(P)-dependent dehydrogenase (short-subunit alcohol dehydrogenase family)
MAMTRVLEGRAALVTGGGRGLGLAIAEAYVAAGASIVVSGRSSHALRAAKRRLVKGAGAGQRVLTYAGDVSRPDDVDEMVAFAVDALPELDIVVNNAGVYGPKGPIEHVDWLEWVHAIEINLLGSVLVARAVLPHLRHRGYGKLIQLSGGGATAPLPYLSAYAASKAAIVRFMETLAHEVRADRIDVNAIAPGALNTRLLDEVIAEGPERVGAGFYARAVEQQASGGTPLEHGASLAVYLASAQSDGITGRLLSAVWDPWATLADHGEELAPTDVYTLRRIVPGDRGLDFGDG